MENIFTEGVEQPITDNLPILAEQATEINTEQASNTAVLDFDFDGATKAGYSPQEIVGYLQESKADAFDYAGAAQAGYQPDEIISHLKGYTAPEEPSRFEWSQAAAASKNESLDSQIADIKASDMDEEEKQELVTKIDESRGDFDITKTDDFRLGIRATIQGFKQGYIDLAQVMGIGDEEGLKAMSQENQELIAELNKNIDDKDFFSKGTLGQVIPTLVTLPIAYQTRLGMFLLEGAIGYGEGRGAGLTEGQSAVTGAIAGTGAVAITEIFRRLATPAQKNVYEYYQKQLGYTDAEADEIFTNWSKVAETEGGYGDKTKSLVDYAGQRGLPMKGEAAWNSPSAIRGIEGEIKARRTAVEDLANSGASVQEVGETIVNAQNVIKENYKRAAWQVKNKPSKTTFNVPEALEEVATDSKAVKELLGKENVTVEDIIDAFPHINAILKRTKGVVNHKWSEVKKAMDGELKEALDPEDYIKWKQANADYKKMAEVRESKVGQTIQKAMDGEITPGEALEVVSKASGDKVFDNIQDMVGSKAAADLEKLIVKQALGDHADDLSWKALAKNMNKKGFTTKEGKQLQEVVENMSKAFKTDDAISSFRQEQGIMGSGIGTNIWERFKVTFMGRVMEMIQKRIPFSETAKHLRMSDKLSKVLASPTAMKQFDKAINEMSDGVKKNILKQAMDDLPKLIEYKPDRPKTATTTNKPLYSTKGGQAVQGEDVSKAVQAEDMIDWIKNSKLDPADTNKVIDSVYKIANDKRIEGILTSVNKKLKVDDAAYNVKVVANAIEAEANILAKRISQDAGVKLGKEDTKKLAHYLFNRYVKECK